MQSPGDHTDKPHDAEQADGDAEPGLERQRGGQALRRSPAENGEDERREYQQTLLCLALGILIATLNNDLGRAQSTELVFPIRENGKWGFIDKTAQTIIPALFEEVRIESATGEECDPAEGHDSIFFQVCSFAEGMAAVKVK